MNLLDRAIAAISPSWALSRVQARATMQQIGTEHQTSNYTAFMDCMAVKKAMPLVLGTEGVELLKARVLERTDAIVRTHWPSLRKRESYDAVLRAMEREAKVVGYDAKREEGYSAEQVAALLRAMRADLLELITDVALRQRIGVVMQRRAGLLAGEVIEVLAGDGHG